MKLGVVLEARTIEFTVEGKDIDQCAERAIVEIMDHGFGDFRGSDTIQLWTVRQVGPRVQVVNKVGMFDLVPKWFIKQVGGLK